MHNRGERKNEISYLCLNWMKKSTNISLATQAAKLASVMLLVTCLILLTGVNFFVYPNLDKQGSEKMSSKEKGSNESSPSPVEEKAASVNTTIQEEYVHDYQIHANFLALEIINHHRIIEAGKLCVVHLELISPPPNA
ncbi:MAG: hypothetical protein ABIW38_07805 [Ferruginibacter sp.]